MTPIGSLPISARPTRLTTVVTSGDMRTVRSSSSCIATERVKWNVAYQKKHGINTGEAKLENEAAVKIKLPRSIFGLSSVLSMLSTSLMS